jgi:hypothetical protein
MSNGPSARRLAIASTGVDMEKVSIIKKVVGAFADASSAGLRNEMPETPGLKLPEGKISTATRKKLLPFVVNETGGPEK